MVYFGSFLLGENFACKLGMSLVACLFFNAVILFVGRLMISEHEDKKFKNDARVAFLCIPSTICAFIVMPILFGLLGDRNNISTDTMRVIEKPIAYIFACALAIFLISNLMILIGGCIGDKIEKKQSNRNNKQTIDEIETCETILNYIHLFVQQVCTLVGFSHLDYKGIDSSFKSYIKNGEGECYIHDKAEMHDAEIIFRTRSITLFSTFKIEFDNILVMKRNILFS